MRPTRLATLIAGAMLSAFASPLSGQRVLADSGEPVTLEAGHGTPATCNSEDIVVYAPEPSSARQSPCPADAREAGETARARAYLIATATPGYTMMRQGPERAIGRLHPEFVNRLAAAIAEARGAGLPFAGIFSAYRPPAFGVGGFADKFHSLHTYGLAVDVTGIGAPGTSYALIWHEIAARHGVICPYGPHNLLEWNHCQPTRVKIIPAENPLRETVTSDGPISLEGMFEVGYSLIVASGSVDGPTAELPAQFFKPLQMPVEPWITPAANIKIAGNRRAVQTGRSVLNAAATKPARLSRATLGWPNGVPRIANLDEEPRNANSAPKSRPSPPKPFVLPRLIGLTAAGRTDLLR
jgi:hypothetical protein